MGEMATSSGFVAPTLDVDNLFRKFTISEIEDIAKKLKLDVERKKEDLRQMVGRRYRDLIEAADNIRIMKSSTEEMLSLVRNAHVDFEKLQSIQQQLSAAQHKARLLGGGGSVNRALANGAERQLLCDLPELIWECIDDGQLLQAAYLFRMMHQATTMEASWSLTSSVGLSPQLQLCKLKDAIRAACSGVLMCTNATVENVTDSVCADLVIEPRSILDALNYFMLQRQHAVDQCFDAALSCKQQITESANIVICSFDLVAAVFVSESEQTHSGICERLNQVFNGIWTCNKFNEYLDSQGDRFIHCLLPKYKDFRPSHPEFSADVSIERCRDMCSLYCEQYINLISAKTRIALSFVNNVTSVVALKDGLKSTLDAKISNWPHICNLVIGSEWSVWETIYGPLIHTATMDIVGKYSDNAARKFLEQFQNIISLHSTTNDVPLINWDANYVLSLSKTGAFDWSAHMAQLRLLARCHSAQIAKICNEFDEHLSNIRNDVDRLIGDLFAFPSSCPIDKQLLEKHLADCYINALKWFCDKICLLCDQLAKNIEAEPERTTLWKFVLCARACLSLSTECPQLRRVMTLSATADKLSEQQLLLTSTRWQTARQVLRDTALHALRQWSRLTLSRCLMLLNSFLLPENNDISAVRQQWLQNAQEWQCVELGESDSSISAADSNIMSSDKVESPTVAPSSRLYLPTQCSPAVQRFLHSLCAALCSIGVHSLPRQAIEFTTSSCWRSAAESYATFISGKAAAGATLLTQRQALQATFDFMWLSYVLNVAEDDVDRLKILHAFESLCDPFDLHLLKQNSRRLLNICMLKNLSLIGPILLPEMRSSMAARSMKRVGASVGNDIAILMPLHIGAPRFTQLHLPYALEKMPYLTGNSQQLLHSSASSGLITSRPSKPGSEGAEASTPKHSLTQTLLHTSSSFYDRISNSWFGV